jgi:hypothetical protein
MRIAIHAERVLSAHGPKLAQATLRYRRDEVVAVIDSTHAGRSVADVTGDERLAHVPVVADVEATGAHGPDTLLIGVSLLRTSIPDDLRRDVLTALGAGLDVVSGLHYALGADPEVVKAAACNGTTVRDLRRPSLEHLEVVPTRRRDGAGWVTLTVGSDASVGKMTTSLELDRCARTRGHSSSPPDRPVSFWWTVAFRPTTSWRISCRASPAWRPPTPPTPRISCLSKARAPSIIRCTPTAPSPSSMALTPTLSSSVTEPGPPRSRASRERTFRPCGT